MLNPEIRHAEFGLFLMLDRERKERCGEESVGPVAERGIGLGGNGELSISALQVDF